MDPHTIHQQITAHLHQHSGLDARREYVGMSSIGRCPRQLYFAFVEGRPRPGDEAHRMCYAGYLFERDLKARLAATGIYVPDSERELVAPFDARFRGHTDGATGDGELLELKSINDKGFERVAVSQRPKTEHALQVQTYLRYGPWTHALVVYVNRATFEHLVLRVAENTRVGLDMEQKAKRVLAAIDARQAPRCECGYCER